jgi:hypothetical protein
MMKTKLFALMVVLVAFAGAASAQTGAGSTDPAAPPPAARADAGDARKACTAAMNADPQFAAAIVKVADEAAANQRDDALVKIHKEAHERVQKNERSVIYSYAAMWIVAAGFVIFLWRRQQGLKMEIASLRRDLEAAADTPAGAKERT